MYFSHDDIFFFPLHSLFLSPVIGFANGLGLHSANWLTNDKMAHHIIYIFLCPTHGRRAWEVAPGRILKI